MIVSFSAIASYPRVKTGRWRNRPERKCANFQQRGLHVRRRSGCHCGKSFCECRLSFQALEELVGMTGPSSESLKVVYQQSPSWIILPTHWETSYLGKKCMKGRFFSTTGKCDKPNHTVFDFRALQSCRFQLVLRRQHCLCRLESFESVRARNNPGFYGRNIVVGTLLYVANFWSLFDWSLFMFFRYTTVSIAAQRTKQRSLRCCSFLSPKQRPGKEIWPVRQHY